MSAREIKEKIPLIALIGEPNVGKSTLLKRLTGSKQVVIAKEAHTTRDLNYGETYWDGYLIRFVDTGGLVPDPEDKIQKEVQLKSWSAMAEADLLVWLISRKRDPDTISQATLQKLWKIGKPFIVAVSKVDDPNHEGDLADYAQFGGIGFINFSSHSSYGVNDLLDSIVNWLEENNFEKPAIVREPAPTKERFKKDVAQTVKQDREGGYYIVRENTPQGPGLFTSIQLGEEYPEIENVILDFGGVLFNFNHLAVNLYLEKKYGLRFENGVDGKEMWQLWDETLAETEQLAKPHDADSNEYWDLFFELLAKKLGLEPEVGMELRQVFTETISFREDVVQFVEELLEEKSFYYLTNSSDPQNVENRVATDLVQQFDGGLSSHWVGLRKPDPEIYKLLLKKYRLEPAKTLFVDDKPENVFAATNLGMHGIIYHSQKTDLLAELEQIEATPKPKREIKNLVFDFYNVVFDQGEAAFRQYLAERGVFEKPGAEEIFQDLMNRFYHERVDRQELAKVVNELDPENPYTEEELDRVFFEGVLENPIVCDFLTKQKLTGKNIYYLTNIGSSLPARQASPIFPLFDGGVASCEAGVSKPDPKIYQMLIDKYGLDPEETVFIDDKMINIEAGREVGFWGIQYLGQETDLDTELEKIEQGIVDRIPKTPKVLLLGRPNVGKSSLFNQLTQKDLQIVTEIPGTTLSVNDYLIEQAERGKKYVLLDSTGIRKSGQRTSGVETFATYKTVQAAHEADVICLVVDGSQPLTHQDQVVAGICQEAKTGLVVVANKADLVDEEQRRRFQKDFRHKFKFLKIDKFIWTSAINPVFQDTPSSQELATGKLNNQLISEKKTKVNPEGGSAVVSNGGGASDTLQIWQSVDESLESRSKVIDRGKLRTLFNYLMKQKPPKKMSLKKRPVVYDLIYTEHEPPTFELLIKDSATIHWSYVRFLENIIRKQFNLHGTGVVVKLTPVSRKRVLS